MSILTVDEEKLQVGQIMVVEDLALEEVIQPHNKIKSNLRQTMQISKDRIPLESKHASHTITLELPSLSTEVDNAPSETISYKSDSTASIKSYGVVNPAFVDEDVLKEIEKKHQRTLTGSIENNDGVCINNLFVFQLKSL